MRAAAALRREPFSLPMAEVIARAGSALTYSGARSASNTGCGK
jgi:hypothetical protein